MPTHAQDVRDALAVLAIIVDNVPMQITVRQLRVVLIAISLVVESVIVATVTIANFDQ
jgi:hypothetical protein